jgi:hypothetical protein
MQGLNPIDTELEELANLAITYCPEIVFSSDPSLLALTPTSEDLETIFDSGELLGAELRRHYGGERLLKFVTVEMTG